jgi:hypothetical protein
MHNLWRRLPKTGPFVLQCDKGHIQRFNAQAKPVHQIHLELLPEPYLGDPQQAKVIFLSLNPGYEEMDSWSLQDKDFVEASRANLMHERQEYPFFLLNPKFASSSGGFCWWRDKLKTLIYRYGFEKLANDICAIEYFPYHSKNFGFNNLIPSQCYSFYLVEEAMKRDAPPLIIWMWGRQWQEAIPRLNKKKYPNYYALRSQRNVKVTEKNCPDGYPEILKALDQT